MSIEKTGSSHMWSKPTTTKKGGVDVGPIVDECIEDFTCKRKTRRYILFFSYSFSCKFVYCDASIKTKLFFAPKIFIKKASDSFAFENSNSRYNSPKIFTQLQSPFRLIGLEKSSSIGPAGEREGPMMKKVGRCCKCRKSTQHCCSQCFNLMCNELELQIFLLILLYW